MADWHGCLAAALFVPGPGSDVACAVSGGTDSMAMLALAVASGCSARAVYVDHGLRPEAPAKRRSSRPVPEPWAPLLRA